MLLENKIAVIYGGAGSVGNAVARAFATEGAIVIVTGRTLDNLQDVARNIITSGGKAEAEVIDASDKEQVESHLCEVIKRYGKIDISFNAIGADDIQGEPLTEMDIADFKKPILTMMHSLFITSTAAARFMRKNNNGTILTITANAARKPYENTGGFGISCAAIEALCRQLAIEEGKHGIRVMCIRSAGSPDAAGVNEVFTKHAANAGISRQEFESGFAERTMLKRLPKLHEIGNAAVLLASDKASALTAVVLNATCGELAD